MYAVVMAHYCHHNMQPFFHQKLQGPYGNWYNRLATMLPNIISFWSRIYLEALLDQLYDLAYVGRYLHTHKQVKSHLGRISCIQK